MQKWIKIILKSAIIILCVGVFWTDVIYAQNEAESPLLLFPDSQSIRSYLRASSNPEAARQELLVSLAVQALVLKDQGLLQSYMIQSEIGAMRIVGATPEALLLLRKASPVTLSALPETVTTRTQARQQLTALRYTTTPANVLPSASAAAQNRPYSTQVVRASLFIDENQVNVYGDAINTSVAIRLFDSNNGLKAETTITTDADGYAAAQLSAVVRSGDLVIVQASGQNPIQTTVPRLVIEVDKVTDTIRGEAPANQFLDFFVQAWRTNEWHSHATSLTMDGNGRYELPIGSQWDLRMSDLGAVVSSGEYFDTFRNFTVPGYWVNFTQNYVGGIGLPAGVAVTATLYDSKDKLLSEGKGQVNSYGEFSIWDFIGCELNSNNIQIGHYIVFQITGQPLVRIDLPSITLTIDATNNMLVGRAPVGAKLSGQVWLSSGIEVATDIDTFHADNSGNYNANFTGRFDVQAGDWGELTYYDAQDNRVYATVRVRGLLAADLTYDSVDLSGNPNQSATLTLRNALGAIKGMATATIDETGAGYVNFYDAMGNRIDLAAGDTLQARDAGLNESYALSPLTVAVNRTTRTVSGKAMAGMTLLIEVGYGNRGKIVTVNSDGTYAATFDAMVGGDSVRVVQRLSAYQETSIRTYVPQITVNPWSVDNSYVYGYAVPQQTVLIEVRDHATQLVKARGLTQADQSGWYSINLDAGIQPLDRVAMQSSNLQIEYTLTPVNVQVNGITNFVAGEAVPQAKLSVSLERSIDGFSWYYAKDVQADTSGSFATNLGGVDFWPGDQFVVFYQTAQGDRQRQIKALPNLEVDQSLNRVYSRGEPGTSITLRLREPQGLLLSTITFTPTTIYQRILAFSNANADGVIDLLPGQTVEWESNGQRIVTVIPTLMTTMDSTIDQMSGTGPANKPIYAAAFHWRERWYSTWSGQTDISEEVMTNASGAFAVELRCKADLQQGDYAVVHYLDDQQNYHRAYGFTTQPTLQINDIPSSVRAGEIVRVTWEIANGAHTQYTYVSWFQPETMAYESTADLWGGTGPYQAEFAAPNIGPIEVAITALVDGQSLRVTKRIEITGNLTLALQDPVNGTTNQAQPFVQGVAVPGAILALYDGQTLLVEGQAGVDGFFSLQPTGALVDGLHELYVRATVAPTLTVESSHLQVKVDTTLAVDPMHIYITNRDQRQRIRDDQGYADLGGRVWTRSGDTIEIEIPIRCTDVRTADLLVGGIYATSLVADTNDRWIGTYTPPSSGNYALALQLNCAGIEQRVTLLTGLIDPDGYVHWATSADLRIAGATVTCYQLLEGEWRVWPGQLYSQQNPQTTESDGYYAFFTEPGQYKIRVEAAGFDPYESPVLTVIDEPVHHNAPLVTKMRLHLPIIAR